MIHEAQCTMLTSGGEGKTEGAVTSRKPEDKRKDGKREKDERVL